MATFDALAENLTGSIADAVRSFRNTWLSLAGTTRVVADFVFNYGNNATYARNSLGLSDALEVLGLGLSEGASDVSFLQTSNGSNTSVSPYLAAQCSLLASYRPLFGEGALLEMLSESLGQRQAAAFPF